MNVLKVRGLGFSWGEKPVFDNLDFDLQKGELLAVLGPNGCGKTSLFRCVLGLERRYSGTVLADGEDTRCKKTAEMARLFAYVPQKIHPVFNYSVMEMVLMGATAGGRDWALPGKRHYEDAMLALEETGICELTDRNFRELSGGEQQLVLIARALVQKAQILVMDEPDSSLDYGNQHRLTVKINGLIKSGCSVILSTHNPNQAFRFANRVLALHNQRAAAFGPPAEVLTEDLIRTLYGLNVNLNKDEKNVIFCTPV